MGSLSLIKDAQWTTVTSRRKQKANNNMGCHIISLGLDGYDSFSSLLTDSDKEQIAFMADITSCAGTKLGKNI